MIWDVFLRAAIKGRWRMAWFMFKNFIYGLTHRHCRQCGYKKGLNGHARCYKMPVAQSPASLAGGMNVYWREVSKCDREAREIAKPHYSRAKPDSAELGPPGQKIVACYQEHMGVLGMGGER